MLRCFTTSARQEDLFAELLDRTVSPALSATAWLITNSGKPEVRLYVLAQHDVTNLCGTRHHLAALQLLPEVRDVRFAEFGLSGRGYAVAIGR